jgi:hypothetical protein
VRAKSKTLFTIRQLHCFCQQGHGKYGHRNTIAALFLSIIIPPAYIPTRLLQDLHAIVVTGEHASRTCIKIMQRMKLFDAESFFQVGCELSELCMEVVQ